MGEEIAVKSILKKSSDDITFEKLKEKFLLSIKLW